MNKRKLASHTAAATLILTLILVLSPLAWAQDFAGGDCPTETGQSPVSPVVKLYPTTESAYFVDSVLCSVRNIDCEGCFTCELLTRRDFPLLSIHRPHPIRNE